ncbi:MAG: alpha/beta fold hydrolase [Desulfovibrionaceae bacterium]|nr:alpha/beta fold hydrolase [Desulfovibrionaceae bacterium]
MLKRSFVPFLVLLLSLFITAQAQAYTADIAIDQQVVPLERNGQKLYLERMTVAQTAPAKNILLVHGLTYSSHEFDVDYADYSLARYLATQGYAVWRLDVAGYGSSADVKDGFMPNSDYAAEDVAAAAKLIIEQSGQKQIDVLGWSWGTVTSGRFAAKHPEMVRKLVLYAPILVGLGEYDVTKPFNENTWVHAAGDFQVTASGDIDYSITDPAVVATFQSNAWRYDKDSSPNGGRKDLLVKGDVRLIPFEKISVPTLVICGDKDPYLNMDSIRKAMPELASKESKLFVIPGAAHAMMMERPYYKLFRETVVDYLK